MQLTNLYVALAALGFLDTGLAAPRGNIDVIGRDSLDAGPVVEGLLFEREPAPKVAVGKTTTAKSTSVKATSTSAAATLKTTAGATTSASVSSKATTSATASTDTKTTGSASSSSGSLTLEFTKYPAGDLTWTPPTATVSASSSSAQATTTAVKARAVLAERASATVPQGGIKEGGPGDTLDTQQVNNCMAVAAVDETTGKFVLAHIDATNDATGDYEKQWNKFGEVVVNYAKPVITLRIPVVSDFTGYLSSGAMTAQKQFQQNIGEWADELATLAKTAGPASAAGTVNDVQRKKVTGNMRISVASGQKTAKVDVDY